MSNSKIRSIVMGEFRDVSKIGKVLLQNLDIVAKEANEAKKIIESTDVHVKTLFEETMQAFRQFEEEEFTDPFIEPYKQSVATPLNTMKNYADKLRGVWGDLPAKLGTLVKEVKSTRKEIGVRLNTYDNIVDQLKDALQKMRAAKVRAGREKTKGMTKKTGVPDF